MKKVSFEEFCSIIEPIEKFNQEIDGLNNALSKYFDGQLSTIGYEIIDAYIELAERYLELNFYELNQYIFENKYKNKKIFYKKMVKESKNV